MQFSLLCTGVALGLTRLKVVQLQSHEGRLEKVGAQLGRRDVWNRIGR
jgi:hypothetical protein